MTDRSVELPEPLQPEDSPFLPRHLIDLFFHPSEFFGGQLALGKTPYLLFVAWCYGASQVADRIDQSLIRAELGRPRPGWEDIAPYVVESWLGFWALLGVMGSVSAAVIWVLGGWWFAVRLRWSGNPSPDRHLARLVMVYSAFVQTGPFLLAYVAYTFFYASYAEAFASDELYSASLMVFPFWSIFTSYAGARAVFGVEGWRARLWFLVLPLVFYILAFGLIAALFAFVPDPSAA